MTEPSRVVRQALFESIAAEHFERYLSGGHECFFERATVLRAAARLPERKAALLLRLAQHYSGNPRIRQLCAAL